MFKTVLTYFLIILDVMIFPFSCVGGQRYNKPEYLFDVEIVDEDREYTFFYSSGFISDTDGNASFPEGFLDDLNSQLEEYEIVGWYLERKHNEEDHTLITFPYSIQEEDYHYWKGHRKVVVFSAEWVYIGNASA